ncbi:RraA family protein [Mesorhizobium sp. YR577]|uniref:RraA family protein n=1 Tax=Mesorhizobium sp. YR577 TaxID=1884373 RepID=UPI0008E5DF29|nr:RraA family protein [Mesorhizobium sp. YR577]SFU16539.1 Regulator of RNase E activity RraA [Mesorhizobium sp. YR577]
MTAGFRIRTQWNRLDRAFVDDFAKLPVSVVSDVMSRLASGGANLRPMHRSGVLAGAALTVKARPGDNLMIHKAIEMAELGDVIVVDAGGDVTNSLMGELMLAHAIQRGVAGFVLNGAIRDAEAFLERNLPVYALGITHRGPYRDGPGEIGLPISLCGMTVEPGDLILGDLDGVVSVARADLEAVLAGARKKHAAEQLQMQQTEEGAVDKSWIDKVLAQKGCVYL